MEGLADEAAGNQDAGVGGVGGIGAAGPQHPNHPLARREGLLLGDSVPETTEALALRQEPAAQPGQKCVLGASHLGHAGLEADLQEGRVGIVHAAQPQLRVDELGGGGRVAGRLPADATEPLDVGHERYAEGLEVGDVVVIGDLLGVVGLGDVVGGALAG